MEEPAVITGFEPVGRRKTKFNVFMNEVLWAELDAETFVREGLCRGLSLDSERRQAILATDAFVRARKAAAGYNARQPRTRRELERYLRNKFYPAPAIEQALAVLTESGTLSDLRVAERVARVKRRKADMGPRRMEAELKARGLPRELVQQQMGTAFAGADLAAECSDLAHKLSKKYAPLHDPKQRQKLLNYLLRRGYAMQHIAPALRTVNSQPNDA